MNKDVRQAIKRLRKQGWRVEITGMSHLRCYPPNGSPYIIMASTPSSRGFANDRARLRRAGADI